jgi:hypothetical protein
VGFDQPDPSLRIREALGRLRTTRLALDARERELVQEARRAHVSWLEIGESLGISTQAAHRRFRDLDPASKPRTHDPFKAELDAFYASLRLALPSTQVEGSDPSTSVDAGAG